MLTPQLTPLACTLSCPDLCAFTQRLQAAVQAELAELRAQAAAYLVDTERQLEAARTDAAVLERRALGAEAELARVRAEAMSIQQQAQAQKLQVRGGRGVGGHYPTQKFADGRPTVVSRGTAAVWNDELGCACIALQPLVL